MTVVESQDRKIDELRAGLSMTLALLQEKKETSPSTFNPLIQDQSYFSSTKKAGEGAAEGAENDDSI